MIKEAFGAFIGWLLRKLFPTLQEPSTDRQLGRAETENKMQDEVIANVEKAQAADSVPDADRDERLRKRFDRAAR